MSQGKAIMKILAKVPVNLPGGRSYDIEIGDGLIGTLGAAVRSVRERAQVLIVTDTNIAALHLDKALRSLKSAKIEAHPEIIPAGEKSKNLRQYAAILERITKFDDARDLVVVALGGGVVGDLAGFTAATYKRGVPFVQVPTSLLACVDSSVGGKTGIDLPAGKNLVGAFHQPGRVIIDLALMRTLPLRELRNGYSEAAKTALIFDKIFFAFLESNIDGILAVEPAKMAEVVRRCCEHKARVVARDERDTLGHRALLNFGHTFGHAAEAALGYKRLLHGEAVAAGMLCAADLSAKRGLITTKDVSRIEAHLAAAGLPAKFPKCDPAEIFEHIKYDKKFAAGKARVVLLKSIGDAALFSDVKLGEIRAAISRRTFAV